MRTYVNCTHFLWLCLYPIAVSPSLSLYILFPVLKHITHSHRSIKFIVELLKCNENEIGIAHINIRKLGNGLQQYQLYIVETAFFYDWYSQFNFIYFCLKWTNISFETKNPCVRVWMCALIFLALEIAANRKNTFKAPSDKSAGSEMVSFPSLFLFCFILLWINKIKFFNLT